MADTSRSDQLIRKASEDANRAIDRRVLRELTDEIRHLEQTIRNTMDTESPLSRALTRLELTICRAAARL
jgi:uncharacterized heparinase superfamily protein